MENFICFGEKFFDEFEIVVYCLRDIEVLVEFNEILMVLMRGGVLMIICGIKDKCFGLVIVDSDELEKVKEVIE